MRRVMAWCGRAGIGFARSAVFAATAVIVPALTALLPVLAALRLIGTPWSWANPWTWIGLALIAGALTMAFARPIGTLFRRLLGRWSALAIQDGYRRAEDEPEPVRLSTGYWWNGHSYERTRRDAEADQRLRRGLGDPAYWRDVRWVVIAAVTVAPVCALPIAGLVGAVIVFVRTAQASGSMVALNVTLGVLLVVASVVIAPHAWRVVAPLAARWLRPPAQGPAAERVRELELQRADLTATQAAEIRRIERDLHDGAQARLIAVGLSLATAERLMEQDPALAKALVREAREGASASLTELRELVRGVNPPVLVERGLADAVRALALDSPLDVGVDAPSRMRLDSPIETALYFGVAELLANAAKHASAARVRVDIRITDARVQVDVIDDGPGGASVVPGGGLDGLRRRLAAFDGTLTVTSAGPNGSGGTHVRMTVPCE